MSDDAAGKADTVAKETEGNGTTAGNAPGCSWEDIMKQYQKSGENAGTNAGYMPGMSFFPTVGGTPCPHQFSKSQQQTCRVDGLRMLLLHFFINCRPSWA
jgi:hypothetical protein